ncbi:MAG: hypothetical protein KF688_02695 [Pirellulales bacterium]|nr:hypothetical protein [Pirellulales bacterium]
MNEIPSEYDEQFERQVERLVREELRAGRTADNAPPSDAAAHEFLAEARDAARLQARVDDSLRRLFPRREAPGELLAALRGGAGPAIAGRVADDAMQIGREPIARLGAAAAVLLIAGFAWHWFAGGRPSDEPYFAPTPLTTLYRQEIDAGFEPYYECHDPERFAAAFQKQLGLPLQLAAMPAGTRMLGLSYSGGLSRQTTSMLCEVDGREVIVFVDLVGRDQPQMADDDGSLRVFRAVRDGLVFYEVTPLVEPRVTEYLQLASAAG